MISLGELRDLLISIGAHQLQISIRYRTLGQLWYPNFLRVVKLEGERSVLFHDEIRKKLISLTDLSRIIQFELDGKHYPFEPNFHYQVSHEDHFKDART